MVDDGLFQFQLLASVGGRLALEFMGTGAGPVDRARPVRVTLTASLLFTAGRADASVALGRARRAVRGDVRWCRVSTVESVRVAHASLFLTGAHGTVATGGERQANSNCREFVLYGSFKKKSLYCTGAGGAVRVRGARTRRGQVASPDRDPTGGTAPCPRRSTCAVPSPRAVAASWTNDRCTCPGPARRSSTGAELRLQEVGFLAAAGPVAWAGCFSPRAVALCAAPCRRRRPLPATAVGGGFPRSRHRTG
jgi:hypothetical protein